MKEDKDKLSRLGPILSARLNVSKSGTGDCPSNEEIAALVDGRVTEQEKDRLMRHISACNECYKVYLLTTELVTEEETKTVVPVKGDNKSLLFKPLALAASLLIVVFSIYVLWQSGDLPKTSQDIVEIEDTAAAPTLESSPPSAFSKRPKAAKTFQKFDLQEEEKPNEEADSTEPTQPSIMVNPDIKGNKKGIIKAKQKATTETKEFKKGTSAVEHKKKDIRPFAIKDEAPAKTPGQTLSRTPKAKVTSREESEKVGEVRERHLAKPRNKNEKGGKKEQFMDDGLQVAEQTRAPKPGIVLNQPHRPGGDIEQKIVVTGKLPAIARLNQMNYVALNTGGYLPASQLQSLFSESLTLAHRLGNDRAMARRQLQPLLKVVAVGAETYIYPDIDYFLARSAPNTVENRFFNLARSGWCDRQGNYYSKSSAAPLSLKLKKSRRENDAHVEDKREGLLKQWRQLHPRLTGVFKEIAHNTISHLKNKSN